MPKSLRDRANSSDKKSSILKRIERSSGVPGLVEILANRLPPTDLQSLLLEVYSIRAKKRRARAVLEDYEANRFTRPSTANPNHLLTWDRIAFSCLPKDFQKIELSPVCPLGTVSGLAQLSQDWTITTIRNTEVVADSTNVLALECALRRQKQLAIASGKTVRVHLASSHRLLRGQKFGVGPGVRQHFRALTLCSGGRDSGSLRFQSESLLAQIGFYLSALREYIGPKADMRVTISDFGYADVRPTVQHVVENLQSSFREEKIEVDQGRKQGRGYYGELCFKIYATPPNSREYELVDGGDVNWTQKLLNDGKERLVISGCGSERLCELFEPATTLSQSLAK